MKVGERTVILMDYELRYPDGELIESSIESNQPLQFVYGRGEVLPAIEKAICEKQTGDQINVRLTPEEAYGQWQEEGKCTIPRSQFPAEMDLEEGMMFVMESEEGRPQPFTVLSADGNDVVVDFNHPLAGQELVFDITIRDVRDATLEELTKAGASSCGPGCDSGSCGSGCSC